MTTTRPDSMWMRVLAADWPSLAVGDFVLLRGGDSVPTLCRHGVRSIDPNVRLGTVKRLAPGTVNLENMALVLLDGNQGSIDRAWGIYDAWIASSAAGAAAPPVTSQYVGMDPNTGVGTFKVFKTLQVGNGYPDVPLHSVNDGWKNLRMPLEYDPPSHPYPYPEGYDPATLPFTDHAPAPAAKPRTFASWACGNRCCPARAPVESPTVPRCYTCGDDMGRVS